MPRRYSKISSMTLCSCDATGCSQEFRSASIPKVIAEQLQLAGWTITEAPTGRWISVGRGRVQEMRTVYLCPDHRPKSRMQGGPSLISTAGRASH